MVQATTAQTQFDYTSKVLNYDIEFLSGQYVGNPVEVTAYVSSRLLPVTKRIILTISSPSGKQRINLPPNATTRFQLNSGLFAQGKNMSVLKFEFSLLHQNGKILPLNHRVDIRPVFAIRLQNQRLVGNQVKLLVESPSTYYTDTPVKLRLELPSGLEGAVQSAKVTILGQISGKTTTMPVPVNKSVQIGIDSELFDTYDEFQISAVILTAQDEEITLTYNNVIRYEARASDYSEESARIPKPNEGAFYGGFIVATAVTVVDFFSEDFYSCTGQPNSFIGYDVG